MSALNQAVKAIRQLLLLQKSIEDLEHASEVQSTELRDVASNVIAIDKRVIRIETMIEMAATRVSTSIGLPTE